MKNRRGNRRNSYEFWSVVFILGSHGLQFRTNMLGSVITLQTFLVCKVIKLSTAHLLKLSPSSSCVFVLSYRYLIEPYFFRYVVSF